MVLMHNYLCRQTIPPMLHQVARLWDPWAGTVLFGPILQTHVQPRETEEKPTGRIETFPTNRGRNSTHVTRWAAEKRKKWGCRSRWKIDGKPDTSTRYREEKPSFETV